MFKGSLILPIFSILLYSFPVTASNGHGENNIDTVNTTPWVQSEGSYHSSGNDIAIDDEGNVYVTGSFEEWIYFNNTKIEANGPDFRRSDIFIAKYDPQGNLLWYDHAGGYSDDAGVSIAVSHNNVYITGYFSGVARFRGEVLQTEDRQNMFLANYTKDGDLKWAIQAKGDGVLRGKALTADSKGNVYVTGNFRKKLSFGRFTVYKKMQQNIYLAKFDSSGVCQWLQQAGGGVNLITYAYVYDIECDADDNIIIAGEMMGPVRFGYTSYTTSYAYYPDGAISRREIYVVKYNDKGQVLWLKDACAECEFGDLALDPNGSIILAGYFKGAVNGNLAYKAKFGHSIVTTTENENLQPSEDIFIAKYDKKANLLWVKSGGSVGDDRALNVATDEHGSVYLTGFYSNAFVMENQSLQCSSTSSGTCDILVAKFSRHGVLKWLDHAGSEKSDIGQAIATDKTGNIFLTGSIEGNAFFGSTSVNGKGYNNFFLAKYFARAE